MIVGDASPPGVLLLWGDRTDLQKSALSCRGGANQRQTSDHYKSMVMAEPASPACAYCANPKVRFAG